MARRSWLVKAKRIKLPLDLGDGDEWIEVKSKLSIGEQRTIDDAPFSEASTDAETGKMNFGVSMAEFDFRKIMTWLTDWSFVDANEKPLAFERNNLELLDEEAYDAIVKALDAHTEKVRPRRPRTQNGEEGKALPPPGETEVLSADEPTPGLRAINVTPQKVDTKDKSESSSSESEQTESSATG